MSVCAQISEVFSAFIYLQSPFIMILLTRFTDKYASVPSQLYRHLKEIQSLEAIIMTHIYQTSNVNVADTLLHYVSTSTVFRRKHL